MPTTIIQRIFIFIVFSIALCAAPIAHAASKTEINAEVRAALTSFYAQVGAGKELANKSVAMLVFPKVYKAGFGIGGEFGEGAMLKGGKTTAYYNTAAASIGFQIGAQVKSQIIMFMTHDALKSFNHKDGWKAGVDGSVAVLSVGAGGQLDTNTITDPIIGFIFSNKGLMYNLTFEGSKITKIHK